jgi:hypothetical protein
MRGRIKFELDRLAEYTADSIVAEIQRVASLLPDEALTVSRFTKHSRVSLGTIRRRFGDWKTALETAGLGHRFSEAVGVPGAHPSVRMSDQEILDALRELARRLDKSELTLLDLKGNLPFSRETLVNRWGNPRAAFEAAGVSSTNLGRRYSDEECFDNLLIVWTHYGRPPMYREMGQPPSQVGGKAYIKRFGTWNKTLAAFVDRANADVQVEQSNSAKPVKANSSQIKKEYRRDIPLGLRFKVLRRDSFKCVLCGDNPPRNLDCVLHVDHIVPWSKGGSTTYDNLRTLCAVCNLGRSNRYLD